MNRLIEAARRVVDSTGIKGMHEHTIATQYVMIPRAAFEGLRAALDELHSVDEPPDRARDVVAIIEAPAYYWRGWKIYETTDVKAWREKDE